MLHFGLAPCCGTCIASWVGELCGSLAVMLRVPFPRPGSMPRPACRFMGWRTMWSPSRHVASVGYALSCVARMAMPWRFYGCVF